MNTATVLLFLSLVAAAVSKPVDEQQPSFDDVKEDMGSRDLGASETASNLGQKGEINYTIVK
jgi:hypothetical protein